MAPRAAGIARESAAPIGNGIALADGSIVAASKSGRAVPISFFPDCTK